MNNFQSLLELFGGLAIFIYGVHLLSEGLEKVAGTQLLSLLNKSLDHPLKQSFFGMVATALMQSSGLLMVTMIGLINANLLTLQQAIGIMLGQEIGTTITGQMISFKIGDFNLIFLIIGFFLMFFSKNRNLRIIGQPLFGFGIVFLGMNLMSKAGSVISQTPFFQQSLLMLSTNILLGVLVGAVFTAAIQSSTAMTGLVIAMGKSNSISLAVAVAIILGANIGSCIMGWLAAMQSGTGAKRASYSQIAINIGGVLLFLPIIVPFTQFVSTTSAELARQIANAHTIFNFAVSALMFPLVKPLAQYIEKIIPEKEEEKEKRRTRFIDTRLLNMPVMAVTMAKEEVLRMGWITHEMVKKATNAMTHGDGDDIRWVFKHEKDIDKICHDLESFLESIPGYKLGSKEQEMLEDLKHLITDIERVGDHANNLAEFAREIEKKKQKISKYGRKELRTLSSRVLSNYGLALKALKTGNKKHIERMINGEDEVDSLEKKYKLNHIERLKNNMCNPELDTIFVESLRNLERISDHAYNITLSLIY
ncbi:MAG TPA: Na/Pi cotransporter family protein [Pelolinea sp.]|nr:Na/Pi cotransporter family protein [Pelolinea sp.]